MKEIPAGRRGTAQRVAADGDLAAVQGDDPGQRLDDRGFACAVLTQQGKHRVGQNVNVDLAQRLGGPEPLAGAADRHHRTTSRPAALVSAAIHAHSRESATKG